MILIFWVGLSFLVAFAGSGKKIGFWGAFFISLIFSPLIGLLFVLVSGTPTTGTDATKNYLAAEKERRAGNLPYAIHLMNESITANPAYAPSHYKLAAYKSLNNDNMALHSLQKAIEVGFSDFQKIKSDPDLEWLRQQPEYKKFEKNDFQKDSKAETKDYLTQLKELGELKQNNIITSEEFEIQKTKILHSNS